MSEGTSEEDECGGFEESLINSQMKSMVKFNDNLGSILELR